MVHYGSLSYQGQKMNKGGASATALLITCLCVLLIAVSSTSAQELDPPAPIPDEPPFILPFTEPPGPSTWLLGQYYGNTDTAFNRRREWYGGGQGIHFGLDFSAPCGTPVVAIGDGMILKVDAQEHGAGPHNLMILHDNGFASFYGHLKERPAFASFSPVSQGQLIGITGDPDISCTSRPHLHLEIRSASLYYGYNPVPFIDADWDTLTLVGPFSDFQQNLENPRQWQRLEDQPTILFGGPIINDYVQPWPPPR